MNRTHWLAFPLFLAPSCSLASQGSIQIGTFTLDQVAERNETHALALAPGQALELVTAYGSIEVHAVDGAAPSLQARVRASGRTLAEAELVLSRYQLVFEPRAEGLRVELRGEPLEIREGLVCLSQSAYVDFVATVPSGAPLLADTGSGDITTHGMLGACTLETSYGSLTLDGARGAVQASSGSGDVSVKDLEGDSIQVGSEYGDVRALDVRASGELTLESGSGDVTLERGRAATIELTTDYGTVTLAEGSGAVKAHSGSGDVRLAGVSGAVQASSDYGTVEVEGVLAGLTASSGSGSVHAHARAGSSHSSEWSLSSDYGSVTLSVTASFTGTLDARTDYGSIECDFPITLEAGKREKNDGKLRGTIGAGGAGITLRSGSGDVALKVIAE
jgi:DUF4097 and DUF4098 domain-containing protein YvlB